ncbi:MAG: hypothetical protein U1A78_05310 [Polyangia bacterium]
MPDPTPPPDAQPTWPLAALQPLAAARLVILRTPDGLELLAAAAAPGGPPPTERDACALARALVAALGPEAFVGSDRAGGEARDLYRITLRGRPRTIGLSVFAFQGRPELALFELVPDAG